MSFRYKEEMDVWHMAIRQGGKEGMVRMKKGVDMSKPSLLTRKAVGVIIATYVAFRNMTSFPLTQREQ